MPDKKRAQLQLEQGEDDIASKLMKRAPYDLVLKMNFVGESPHLLFNHFREMIVAELKAQNMDPHEDPLLGLFAEAHASEMRDFVMTGVSIDHMIHISEIERLENLSASLLQTDIWDSLKKHIATAEEQFRRQAKNLPQIIEQINNQGGLGFQQS